LLGSGAILREVIAAAEMLLSDWGVDAEVCSVTSFTELAREARQMERENRLHPLFLQSLLPNVTRVSLSIQARRLGIEYGGHTT
jgi:pyruvate dehydrogenase complex dehydrogenase (E1) component